MNKRFISREEEGARHTANDCESLVIVWWNGDSGCIVKLKRKVRPSKGHVVAVVRTATETILLNRVDDRATNKKTRVLGRCRGRSSTTDERIRLIKVQEPSCSYQLEKLAGVRVTSDRMA